MGQRLDFQELLEEILGSRNVYFQPKSNTQMNYPAIVYKRNNVSVKRANNGVYNKDIRYSVTSIDRNPDSTTPDKLASLPMSTFDRNYVADGLNHEVYNIYF